MKQRETVVIIASLLIVLGTLLFLVFQLRGSHVLILDAAKNRNENVARILAARFAAGLREVDYILRDVADEVVPSDVVAELGADRRNRLNNFLTRKLGTHSWIVSLSVLTNQAQVVATADRNRFVSPAASALGSSWFAELKAYNYVEFVGSDAIPATEDRPLRVVLARKVHFLPEQFDGVIAADIAMPAIKQEFQGLDFSLRGSISLIDTSGVVLFRNPGPQDLIGARLRDSVISGAAVPGSQSLTIVANSPIDGVEKIIAIQRVEGLPYYAIMASPLQDELGPWHRNLFVSVAAFVVATSFVLLFLAAYLRINRQAQELELFATTDELTKLDNRRHFFDRAAAEFGQARRYKRSLGVLLCDLDHFKQVNDSCGHAAGDDVLRVFAEVCTGSIREGDILGRIGGEEIAIVLHEAAIDQALLVAERIRKDFELRVQGVVDCAAAASTTVSIGVVCLRDEFHDFDAILAAADRALYRAKAGGRNRVERGS